MDKQKDWIYSTNIYEVNLRQYTAEGTFSAFASHLPRLQAMGVETLWLMPITPISGLNRKGILGSYYAPSDYITINPEFGSMEDFVQLVEDIHSRGMKVIIDWVANHTGWDHTWTREHPDWYCKSVDGGFLPASGMDDIIELNFANDQMRAEMLRCMEFWIRQADIDGFRCDLASWVEFHFWEEAIPALSRIKPLFWLGELDPIEHPEYMRVFDAAYTWKWMHQTYEWYNRQRSFDQLTNLLDKYAALPGMPAWFTSNHDENSWNGTEFEKYGDAAAILAVFSFLWKGLPLMYSGQELPLRKRLAFFEKDDIPWTGLNAMEPFYQKLIELRRAPALDARADTFMLPISPSANILAWLRKSGESEVAVFLNFSDNVARFQLQAAWLEGKFVDVFSKTEYDLSQPFLHQLEPWAYTVLKKITA